VISAALLKRSVSRKALDQALDEGELLMSVETLDELNQVLMRPGFARYVTQEERLALLALLAREATFVQVDLHVSVCRDPSDDKFVELAISGSADCVVSGDQDLLVLHPFRDIPIVTPRDFIDGVWKEGS